MRAPVTSVFLTADAVGGVWTHALDLARGLCARGVEVTLAVLGPQPSLAQLEATGFRGCRLLYTGLPLDWTGAGEAELLEAGRCLAGLARDSGAELVHLNSPALAAGDAFDLPLVAGCHSCVATWWETVRGSPLPPEFQAQRALTAAGYEAAGALVAPSGAFADMTARHYGLARAPRVVPNGRPPCPTVVSEHEGILAAGRLWDEAKNIALLDRIAPRLETPILVAGPLAAPHGGIAEFRNLWHLGCLSAAGMTHCLASAGIFVSPARYEPFGLGVLEAAQAGCALVLSDIASFREIWADAALYAAPDDEDGFCQALRALSGDAELRARQGDAARRRAALYTVEAMTEGMLGLYRDLLPHHFPLETAA